MREEIRSFYTMIKSCDDYLHFVFITGISKFSKSGVFSAMNNLVDNISMLKRCGYIVGYTQNELEENFREWIIALSKVMCLAKMNCLQKMNDYRLKSVASPNTESTI